MDHSTHKNILKGCISGDSKAQEAFVREFSDFVYRTIQYTFKTKNTLYNQSDVEDLHNTLFIKLLENRCRKLKQFKGKNGCSVQSWVRLITVRVVIDHLRKTGTQEKKTLPLDTVSEFQGEGLEPIELVERKEQYQFIHNGLQELLPRDRLFLKLHFLEELSIRKVAEIMGLSESNAHSLKHRALKRLKNKMAQNTKATIP